MAQSSEAAASTAAVPEITLTVWAVGEDVTAEGFTITKGKTISTRVKEIAKMFEPAARKLAFYRVSQKDMQNIAKRIKTESQFTKPELEIDALTDLTEDTWVLAVAERKVSATGKCPHSIVFPSVVRSLLTWSRALCVRCCGCLCRGRQRRRGRW